MRFAIYEENLERLTKKLNTIKNKCQAHGYPFMYKEVGEEFRDYKVCPEDPQSEVIKLRYVLVEAQGIVKHDDWEFVAVIEHESAGNIVRAMKYDVQVPDKYFTTEPICEHCNTKRRRKDTYLIYNEVTNEFKQVGKTCLQEFTNGMDAELVASYIEMLISSLKEKHLQVQAILRNMIQLKRFSCTLLKLLNISDINLLPIMNGAAAIGQLDQDVMIIMQ